MAGVLMDRAVFLSTWVKFFNYLKAMRKTTALLAALLLYFPLFSQPTDPRLAKASREDKAGWIYVHLEGSPRDIGFQHGWLLANEIEDLINAMKLSLPHLSGKDWAFYHQAAKKMFWDKIDKEYRKRSQA
jgi:hypothetical protein